MSPASKPVTDEQARVGIRVHKFGGTSVDGAVRLKAMARIVHDHGTPTVVVVSEYL